MKQTDRAILINRISYSESSLILTFYTLNDGIQKFIFQGGKKKSSALFPMSINEITYYKRPDSDLGKLTSVETAKVLPDLPFHPLKSSLAFFMAEVLQKCLRTEEGEKPLFDFLQQRISQLDQAVELSLFLVSFLLDFSNFLGISPDPEEGGIHFNLIEGEITRAKPSEGEIYFSGEAVTLLSDLLAQSDPVMIKAQHSARIQALEILIRYYQLHIPQFKELKSLEVIREIFQ